MRRSGVRFISPAPIQQRKPRYPNGRGVFLFPSDVRRFLRQSPRTPRSVAAPSVCQQPHPKSSVRNRKNLSRASCIPASGQLDIHSSNYPTAVSCQRIGALQAGALRMALAPHSLTPKLSSHESRFGKHPTPTPQQTGARRYHHRRGWALATRYGPQPASQYRRGKHGSRLVAHSQHPEELPGKSGRSDLAQVTSRQDRRILTLTKTGVTPAARIRTVRPPSP